MAEIDNIQPSLSDTSEVLQQGKDRNRGRGTISRDVPCFCSQRWILAYVGFFGFVCVYAVRVNFSMAIVCMVKPENTTIESKNLNTSMPFDPTCIESDKNIASGQNAEFDWSRSTRSSLLASFFYGYICTQIPGGWLSDRFGGKRVFGFSMLVASLATLLMPTCARSSAILVYFLRIVLGLSTGVVFPAVQSMWGRWAPPLERSKLVAVTYLGPTFGNVLTFSTAGVLCEYGFDNGWGSIFYLSGGMTFLWVLLWFYLTADVPAQHRRITSSEREYIERSIEYDTNVRDVQDIGTNLVKNGQTWTSGNQEVGSGRPVTLAVSPQSNQNEIREERILVTIGTDVSTTVIKQNGALSAIPYICQTVTALIAGQTADVIRSRGWLNTTNTRKVYQITAFLGAGLLLIGTGFVSCGYREVAVVLLSITLLFVGFSRAGYICNHVDFAPKYAGILFGITNTVATMPGMIAPIIAGALTPNKTQEEWRNVFYVCTGFDVFGALVFGFFASGEIQDWAKDDVEENDFVEELNAKRYEETSDSKKNTT